MKWFRGVFVFLMLWEWLRPLPFFAPFENLQVFVALTAVFVGIQLFNFHPLIRGLIKLSASFGAICYLYYDFFKETADWKTYLKAELIYNKDLVLNQDWLQTTAFSRTVAFILVLWIVIGIVCHVVLKNNQGIWFGAVTCAYLIMLDITTLYDVKWAFVRVILYSLILLSLIQLRLVERLGIQVQHSSWNRVYWIFSSLAVALLAASVAYAVPKPGEADAVWFGTSGARVSAVQKKVGYESGESKLGGPFLEDETVVFHAITTEKHYWRGQSHAIYTSTEWKDQASRLTVLQQDPDLDIPPLFQNLKQEEYKASVAFAKPNGHVLFYGGQVKQVSKIMPEDGILYINGHDELKAQFPADSQYLQQYELDGWIPLVNEELLKQSSVKYPIPIREAYLQLPATLPDRVRQLAKEITHGIEDPYSKAIAIQDHLRFKGGYVYEREDVPFLSEGQDFVDQFLFETKRGYCDHFSTSMAVLLRASGVPARYVKGFSTGEMSVIDANTYRATIKNKNAHSWVEVYFEGYGWIPFEPTPGFIHPMKRDTGQMKEQKEDVPAQADVPPVVPTQPDAKKEEQVSAAAGAGDRSVIFSWLLRFLLLAALIALGVLWKYRNNIRFWMLQRRVERIQHVNGMYSVYDTFISLLERTSSRRKGSETLQEFVSRLSLQSESKRDLSRLTDWYEKQIYGPRSAKDQNWSEPKAILLKLLRHFIS